MSLRILGRSARLSCLHGLSLSGYALAAMGAIGAASLTACGQTGPLFMPPPPREPAAIGQRASAPATPASAAVGSSNFPEPPPASGPAILLPR